ncbi:hypothetical protein HanIR_Chr11g0527071 [Helianthus annuus]|nr:hypothetical protein HanIR_Chr11g0527071 [Helianthus annuus]
MFNTCERIFSSIFVAQTTRKYCYAQTVCFQDVSLKNICASSS